MCINGYYKGRWLSWRIASPRMVLPDYYLFARTLSLRWVRYVQRHTEGLPLCRSIVVLKQLITDEFDYHAVVLDLLYEIVSMHA